MRRILLLPALVLCAPASAAAQGDTVVAVNPRYEAGAVKRALLGRSYRDLWAAPVRIAVLDLDRFAGGLTPTETGGGNQTLSLRFEGADGREYAFRSVDKDPGRGSGRSGPAEWLLQDQVSSQNPAGALAAARLMDATGALHVDPQLFVMPDHPRLGEFRERFAGMVGQIEERTGDGFAGSPDLKDTDEFLEELQSGPEHRAAAEELLAVRLLDIVLGDWDRHEDQYEWARFDQGTARLWRPVPRDRDYVFVDYDGLLLDVARSFLAKAVRFRPRYDGALYGLIEQGQYLDRRLLGGLDRAEWDSVTAALRARLTDELIREAVAELPPEYRTLRGAELEATLRARRDRLPDAAAAWYRMMAGEPEAHGTDGPDLVIVERLGDGGMDVRIHARDETGPIVFRRRFVPGETREVRVFLHGGDDRAEVRGQGGMLVRVVGGEGDDRFADRGSGARTVFYDASGRTDVVRGPGTTVDTRDFDTPRYELVASEATAAMDPPRDWGTERSLLSPFVAVRPFADLVVGAGPAATRYGFRRYPWATQWYARALYAPFHDRWGAEARYARRWTGSQSYGYVFGRASQMEGTYFAGYGNATERPDGVRDYVLWENEVSLEPGVVLVRPGGLRVNLAGVLRYTDPEPEAGTPALTREAYGTAGTVVMAGARAAAAWDRRDDAAFPRRGWTLSAQLDAFPYSAPGALDPGEEVRPFARTGALATAYLPLAGTVLAVRAGGQAAFGDFPVQYAAFLGGSPTLRGYAFDRFAGDASAFGGAELRVPLAGPVGVMALADAGRVWFDGDSPAGWHTALGAGAFIRASGYTARLTYAYGERGIVYLGLGLPF